MSLVPTESGEVIPFDPFLLIPIGGAIRSVSSTAVSSFRQLYPSAVRQVGKQGAPVPLPKTNILESIKNIFSGTSRKVATTTGAAGAGAATVASTIPKSTLSNATKAAITTGLISLPITTGFIASTTPGGQEFLKDTGQAASNFTSFIQQNGQLISIFLIVGGAALLIGAIKK